MGQENNLNGLLRRIQTKHQKELFEMEPDWRDLWWGMPSFEQQDARPYQRITVNFICPEDVHVFCQKLNIRLTNRADSIWYPQEQIDQPKEWEYADES